MQTALSVLNLADNLLNHYDVAQPPGRVFGTIAGGMEEPE
jgi:hypothetical protein